MHISKRSIASAVAVASILSVAGMPAHALTLEKAAAAATENAAAEAKAKAKAERKAAEAKAKAEKEAAEAKAKAEKKAKAEAEAKAKAERKAAEAKAKAEKEAEKAKIPTPMDILAGQGIIVSGDAAWFTTARAGSGDTFSQLFVDALSKTNFEAAAAIVQTEARESGYYLCSIKASDGKKLEIDPGRFSQIDIRFEEAANSGTNGASSVSDPVYRDEGRWFTREQIRRRLERSMVRPGEPFNYHLLYSQFRDINSNPDLAANIELRLPRGEDAADGNARAMGVDVSVKENWPVHAIVGIDNYSTRSGGGDGWTGRATLQRLNLWKADHALTLNGFSKLNGDLYGGAGSYYIPFELGSRDAAFTLHGGISEVNTDDVVAYIDVEGDGWFYGAQGSVELLDSSRHSLRFALGLTYRKTRDRLELHEQVDGNPSKKLDPTEVELLPLSLSLMYSSKDLDSLMGRNYATLEGVCNWVGDDSDFEESRSGAKPNYWLARAQLARIQTIGGTYDAEKGWSGRAMVFAKLDAQYAADPLVSAEQMGVGGAASVRGYLEREFLGDSAEVFTLEYRTPLYLGLMTRPRDGKAAQDRLQFVAFTDAGSVNREDTLPGERDNEFLWGVGVGLRTAWSDYLQLRFDLATPLHETVESETGDIRCHVSVQAQF